MAQRAQPAARPRPPGRSSPARLLQPKPTAPAGSTASRAFPAAGEQQNPRQHSPSARRRPAQPALSAQWPRAAPRAARWEL